MTWLGDNVIDGHFSSRNPCLGIELSKDSITLGKDADFLVFENDLMCAEPERVELN